MAELTVLCSFVPVIATGFDDLQKRVEAQTQQAAQHQEKIKVRRPSASAAARPRSDSAHDRTSKRG